MAITAAMVKELREMTGAGMMECKKALTETDGNIEAAVDVLKKSGAAKVEKKASRIAAEGVAKVAVDGNTAVVVEVNSETDFVAKNEVFQTYVKEVVDQIVSTDVQDVEALKNEKWALDPSMTVAEKHAAMVAKIGENMNIRRFAKISTDGHIVSYIHAGGKIGVLVEADTDASGEAIDECMKNIAMQVAAMNPKYVSTDEVSEEYKAHELEILVAQAKNDPKNANKPDNIIEKMVQGRLNKELKEVCLLEQEYVKAENKESVAQYVANVAKANGCKLAIKKFVRFETGEGLEKKNEDFAAEVAAQMAGN